MLSWTFQAISKTINNYNSFCCGMPHKFTTFHNHISIYLQFRKEFDMFELAFVDFFLHYESCSGFFDTSILVQEMLFSLIGAFCDIIFYKKILVWKKAGDMATFIMCMPLRWQKYKAVRYIRRGVYNVDTVGWSLSKFIAVCLLGNDFFIRRS